MTVGGIILLIVVSLVWVAFVWLLFREQEPKHERQDNSKPDGR